MFIHTQQIKIQMPPSLFSKVYLQPASKVAKQAGAEAGRAGAASLSFRASDPTDLVNRESIDPVLIDDFSPID